MRCDIFCAVIDNHGDLGVCWRLARQLADEHGVQVTLWVDDLAAFAAMAPGLDPAHDCQMLGGLTIRRWQGEIDDPEPGDLVIEGFGCRPPSGFLLAMASRRQPPLWINLEYLSAEPWVEDCHGMTSTHPQYGLVQHFWFPGFTPRTGGLLRELRLDAARQALQADAAARVAFWSRLGVTDAAEWSRRISLFAYENPAIADLLDTLVADAASSLVLVPAGRALADIARWAGRAALAPGERVTSGRLAVQVLPFLGHDDYDHLLQACDLNLVRGEDSFVRAQWAARPMLWHIYRQDEDAHLTKLDAFISQVETQARPAAIWAHAMRAWNGAQGRPWAELLTALPALTGSMAIWQRHLLGQSDLASGLMRFYADRVESAPVQSHLGTHTR